jgi:serine/threonine protein phosphatase 1
MRLAFAEILRNPLKRPHDRSGRRRERIVVEDVSAAFYAVGDVHGCLSLLKEMDLLIASDNQEREKIVVMLGDYVDRGPASAQVLDYLTARPPANFRRICLAGNHEEAMLSFLEDPTAHAEWLNCGGFETLRSYGIHTSEIVANWTRPKKLAQILESHVPGDHVEFLRRLPVMVSSPDYVMVHGGLRQDLPITDQLDHDLMWLRAGGDATPGHRNNRILVHGHTPVPTALITPHRICVDTEAYRTGVLTAVRVTPDEGLKVLTCSAEAHHHPEIPGHIRGTERNSTKRLAVSVNPSQRDPR